MAKRNRYREMESNMTKIIVIDALVFVLYLVCARYSSNATLNVCKVITAIISIFGSLLCTGWLYLTGEFGRRRSLWMVTAFICIIITVAVSLLLGYPCPPATA